MSLKSIFTLRLPKKLGDWLELESRDAGVSKNAFVCTVLKRYKDNCKTKGRRAKNG